MQDDFASNYNRAILIWNELAELKIKKLEADYEGGMMLSEVVRKHLLKDRKRPLNDDDLEIAIHAGWTARDIEIEKLKAENARYREALEYIQLENKKGYIDFNDQYKYWRDQEFKSRIKAREALKGVE